MPPKNPKTNIERLERALGAWTNLAPDKQFGGMNKEDFEASVNASKSARNLIKTIENQLTNALALREQRDQEALVKLQSVKNGILADPDHGPNSSLYESIGYIRQDDRKSGLTRKKNIADKPEG
jgi:hypothetical protein